MDLTQLTYFIRVAEMGSFSKAAIQLDLAQPTLSRQVRLLEAELRMALLQRTGRGVVLTEAGQRLYEHGVSILQLVSYARDDLESSRNEPMGRIVVGLPPSMGRVLTVPMVDEFKRAFPRARLAIVEGLSAHLIEWISTGRVDLGLVHTLGANPALDTTPVLDEPLCLVSSAAGGDAHGPSTRDLKPLPFDEVPQYPLIVPEQTHAIRRLLETHAAMNGLKLQVAYEVSSVQSILELVRHRHGHAVLPRSAVLAAGRPKDFTVRPLLERALKSTLCLALSANKPATPLVKQAARLLRNLLLTRIVQPPQVRGGRYSKAL